MKGAPSLGNIWELRPPDCRHCVELSYGSGCNACRTTAQLRERTARRERAIERCRPLGLRFLSLPCEGLQVKARACR